MQLDIPNTKGITKRKELNYVYKQTGNKPSLLQDEPVSSKKETRFLNLFWSIIRTKNDKQSFLSLQDILNYKEIYKTEIPPIIVDLLLSLDNTMMLELNKE